MVVRALLAKVLQGAGSWSLSLRIGDAEGKAGEIEYVAPGAE